MTFFLSVLKKNLAHADAYVMDMGINDGYLSALAVSHGYGVICADAQPECVRNFTFAIALNGWERVEVYNTIIGLDTNVTLEVPNGVCSGSSTYVDGKVGMHGHGIAVDGDLGASTDLIGVTKVSSTTVDRMVGSRNILFWHLDVEGSEIDVLKSEEKLLSEKRLQYLQTEFISRHYAKYPREEALKGFLATKVFANFDCVSTFHMLDSRPKVDGDWVNYLRTHLNRIVDWPKFFDGAVDLPEHDPKPYHDILCVAKQWEHW